VAVTPRYACYAMANLVRKRFLDQLDRWLTPELLYHCFTGESDPDQLAHAAELDHALQLSLLAKVERQWPGRLEAIAQERQRERNESRRIVRTYTNARNQAPRI
jgi:hypothetical protein